MKTTTEHFFTVDQVEELALCTKEQIEDHFRINDENLPGILICIATNDDGELVTQTGTIEHMGADYGLPYWAWAGVYRTTDCRKLALRLIASIEAHLDPAKL